MTVRHALTTLLFLSVTGTLLAQGAGNSDAQVLRKDGPFLTLIGRNYVNDGVKTEITGGVTIVTDRVVIKANEASFAVGGGDVQLRGDVTMRVLAQSQAPVASQAEYVYITGAVRKTGRYQLSREMSILELITQSGGLEPFADQERILVVRGTEKDATGKPVVLFVNFGDLMKGKDLVANLPTLKANDQVIVRNRR
jgi:hypothetical protein